VAERSLPALGMLLELTMEVTGTETFGAWAAELRETLGQRPRGALVPFFAGRARGERYEEVARQRTPDVVRRWGFSMATPIDDFRAAVTRFCQSQANSTVRT
jgi:hypothetical protein